MDMQVNTTFIEGFMGGVIGPMDADYDSARALYNGMIDKRPQLIARCADVADVMTAVNFGRGQGLLIAVRGGGHSGAGLASCDGGIVIDLSRLKGVRVDPVARTVRVEPGCTQGEVDHAASAFGLAVPAGIVASTGVAGLTLGGGHGYLSRKYGLTVDNLIEADVVLADGTLVTANEHQHADLFWALRGGGGNFGVVTSFLYRAHPVANVYAGPIFWDFAHAKEVMRFYREFLPKAPPELCPFLGLKTVPSVGKFPQELWGRRVCALISCFNGSAAEGEKAMRPVRDALPKPLLDGMQEMPFATLQSLFDPLLPKGMQWYWKGDFVTELTDAAIDAHLEHAAKSPSEMSLMHLYPIDGAVHRVGVGD
ncbi:MAG: FAD-binding oxidoreductase, partial [Rhodospirillales bacterium]|nr:FAD-binding oxidoreductase [Rhodospirillales bacterium]